MCLCVCVCVCVFIYFADIAFEVANTARHAYYMQSSIMFFFGAYMYTIDGSVYVVDMSCD